MGCHFVSIIRRHHLESGPYTIQPTLLFPEKEREDTKECCIIAIPVIEERRDISFEHITSLTPLKWDHLVCNSRSYFMRENRVFGVNQSVFVASKMYLMVVEFKVSYLTISFLDSTHFSFGSVGLFISSFHIVMES